MNREETQIDKEFSPNKIPAQYADNPNLWWMACELSKFKEPYKAADLAFLLAGPLLKKGGQSGQQRAFQPVSEQLQESPCHICCLYVLGALIQQMGAQEARHVWRFVQALSGKGKDRA